MTATVVNVPSHRFGRFSLGDWRDGLQPEAGAGGQPGHLDQLGQRGNVKRPWQRLLDEKEALVMAATADRVNVLAPGPLAARRRPVDADETDQGLLSGI